LIIPGKTLGNFIDKNVSGSTNFWGASVLFRA